MKIYILGILAVISFLFFLSFRKDKSEIKVTSQNLEISNKESADNVPVDSVPKFYALEMTIDSQQFDIYMSEICVSSSAYFQGTIMSKLDGIPHFFIGSLLLNGDKTMGGFHSAKEMAKLPQNQNAQKIYTFDLYDFGEDKDDIQISFIKNKSGNFEGVIPKPNHHFLQSRCKLASFKNKTESLDYKAIPRWIVSKNSVCGVAKEGWQDLMTFNFLEFKGDAFDNDAFLHIYCDKMQNPYKSYFYDYYNSIKEDLDKFRFSSKISTFISHINKSFVSGIYTNVYINLEHDLSTSAPFLYSIKERKNLILSDIIKSDKKQKVKEKVLEFAKQSPDFESCSINSEEITTARFYITFKGINLIFCSENPGNRNFQGLDVFVPFDQIKDLLTDDFKSSMGI